MAIASRLWRVVPLRVRRGVVSVGGARWIAALGLLGLFPLSVRMALDSGITTDEFVQRNYGDMVLGWYRSGFTDRAAISYRDLYLYGGLFDLTAQALNATKLFCRDVFDLRHSLSSLVAVSGVCATWLAGHRTAGPRAALFAAMFLALTPAWIGHGLFNCKDIPFGTAAAFVMLASMRIVMRRGPLRWSDAFCAAVALGCTLAIRSGGMFMLAYPLLAIGARAWAERHEWPEISVHPLSRSWLRHSLIGVSKFVCMLPITWALMLSAWPWAQQEPLTRPFTAASVAANFSWHGQLRFKGELITEEHIPASYLPTWFGLTLPDTYLLALGCALIAVVGTLLRRQSRTRRTAAVSLLIVFVLAPLLAVIIRRPVIYNAHRHFLFLLPPLATLAGLALDHVLNGQYPALLRRSVSALALGLASLTAYDMWSLHPYQYVYFNRISGGLPAQGPRFDTDYWGSSYREAFEWVIHHYDPGGTRQIKVKTCSADKVIRYYREQWQVERFVLANSPRAAEVFLDPVRPDCHELPGDELHRIERQGLPLIYLMRLH